MASEFADTRAIRYEIYLCSLRIPDYIRRVYSVCVVRFIQFDIHIQTCRSFAILRIVNYMLSNHDFVNIIVLAAVFSITININATTKIK